MGQGQETNVENLGMSFPSSTTIIVWCMYALKSPHRCDSNEYTQHTFS